MRHHQNILEYEGGRYLKIALALCTVAIALYAWHEPPVVYTKPYGGTWLGYTLGTVAALLIVWLMLLGVRKRRYRSSMGRLNGWTSAHVYLGLALVVVATLHCAFEFGWNVHTLAYVLMVAVVASGLFGVYAYLHYPELITHNLRDETPEDIVARLDELDRKCRRLALDLPDEVNAIVVKGTRAAPRPSTGRREFQWYFQSAAAHCPTRAACDRLLALRMSVTGAQAKKLELLITEMTRKHALLERVRRDLKLRTLLHGWLFFHVPLAFALLAALVAHVISVFYYW